MKRVQDLVAGDRIRILKPFVVAHPFRRWPLDQQGKGYIVIEGNNDDGSPHALAFTVYEDETVEAQ